MVAFAASVHGIEIEEAELEAETRLDAHGKVVEDEKDPDLVVQVRKLVRA